MRVWLTTIVTLTASVLIAACGNQEANSPAGKMKAAGEGGAQKKASTPAVPAPSDPLKEGY